MTLGPYLRSLLLLASTSTVAACSTTAEPSSDADAAGPDSNVGCGSRETLERTRFDPRFCDPPPPPPALDGGDAGDGEAGGDAGPGPDAGAVDSGRRDRCPVRCVCPNPNPNMNTGASRCGVESEAGVVFPFPGGPEVTMGQGDIIVCVYPGPACGRAPAGLVTPSTESTLEGYLLLTAHLETAAVLAFEHLARDLTLHDAPEELVARALRGADDERRHQRAMEALCERRGLVPLPVVAASYVPRSLQAFAEDNAIEGCGRETLGALVALHQAEHADTEELRAIMRVIADDEVSHAELAWDIAAWLAPRLSRADRARLDRARRDALAAFQDMTFPGSPMGLPSTEALGFYAASLTQGLPLAA